jgi:hypothetical protein
MGSICEWLINVVSTDKPKWLIGLDSNLPCCGGSIPPDQKPDGVSGRLSDLGRIEATYSKKKAVRTVVPLSRPAQVSPH